MRLAGIVLIILSFSLQSVRAVSNPLDSLSNCRKAFIYKTDEFAVGSKIIICSNAMQVPVDYETTLNMSVCDDKLCANVLLKICWDLAGNFLRFDTIAGKPLTKFDHKRFSDVDYKKLDQILKDRNSLLRVLGKSDLVDKSIKLKATSVDAVTGATPASLRNAVVEGAVYSSYALWHFVNGPVGDSLRSFTLKIYSKPIAFHLLESPNFETQMFALKQFSVADYEVSFDRLVKIISKSSPLIRAYFINKIPLPFSSIEKNRQFVCLYSILDDYSKSVFLTRVTTEEKIAKSLLPLVLPIFGDFNEKQQELIVGSCQKFEIFGYQEFMEKMKSKK